MERFFFVLQSTLMTPDLDAARKMFFEYACSHFYMAHDGELESYRQLGASPADEERWRSEYVTYWVGQLSLDDLTAINRLTDAHAWEALPDLMERAGQGDGYAQLWFANAIWNLVGTTGTNISAELTIRARVQVVSIWQRLEAGAFVLTEAHRMQLQPSLASFEVDTPEEYVRKYARHQFENLRWVS